MYHLLKSKSIFNLILIIHLYSFNVCGFQDFEFKYKYDCIWLQWFLMYLHDKDLIEALCKCRENLNQDDTRTGLIFVKENAKSEGALLDKSDNSIARSLEHFEVIFKACGLKIIDRT